MNPLFAQAARAAILGKTAPKPAPDERKIKILKLKAAIEELSAGLKELQETEI